MTTQNLPATRNDQQPQVDGLEDLNPDEVAIPRIRIKHAERVFEDALSGEQFPAMYGVVMGLVKQRILWKPEMTEGPSKPRCKSSDNITGYPTMEAPDSDDLFQWREVGLDPAAQPLDQQGRVTMACETCPLAQWGKRDAKGKAKPPPCRERYTLPVMYSTTENGPIDRAGIVSFQGSGISAWKAYFASFQRSRRPVYSAMTAISLEGKKRGMVEYSVPIIQRIGETNPSDHEMYSNELAGIRAFLRRPPRHDSDDDDADAADNSVNMTTAPAQATYAQPTQPAQPATGGLNVPGMQVNTPSQAAPVVQGTVMENTPPPSQMNDDLPF